MIELVKPIVEVSLKHTACCSLQEVCYQYWPGRRAQSYGEFRVELLSEEKKRGFVLRTFSVLQAKVSVRVFLVEIYS